MTLLAIEVADEAAERVRRSHHDALAELQGLALAGARILQGVTLEDGVAKTIAHGLGRKPAYVSAGIPRGAIAAGYVVETSRDARSLVLTASGYGATITVDLVVA